MSAPARYSSAQIWLHWIVVILVAAQILLHDSIAHAWYGALRGEPVTSNSMILFHIVAGVLVGLLMVWRFALRLTRGAPPPPAGGSPLQNLAAGLVHLGLYAVLIAMSLTGLVAWFGMVRLAGELHSALETLMLLLIGVHVLAAGYHQFFLRDNLMARMSPPSRRAGPAE